MCITFAFPVVCNDCQRTRPIGEFTPFLELQFLGVEARFCFDCQTKLKKSTLESIMFFSIIFRMSHCMPNAIVRFHTANCRVF